MKLPKKFPKLPTISSTGGKGRERPPRLPSNAVKRPSAPLPNPDVDTNKHTPPVEKPHPSPSSSNEAGTSTKAPKTPAAAMPLSKSTKEKKVNQTPASLDSVTFETDLPPGTYELRTMDNDLRQTQTGASAEPTTITVPTSENERTTQPSPVIPPSNVKQPQPEETLPKPSPSTRVPALSSFQSSLSSWLPSGIPRWSIVVATVVGIVILGGVVWWLGFRAPAPIAPTTPDLPRETSALNAVYPDTTPATITTLTLSLSATTPQETANLLAALRTATPSSDPSFSVPETTTVHLVLAPATTTREFLTISDLTLPPSLLTLLRSSKPRSPLLLATRDKTQTVHAGLTIPIPDTVNTAEITEALRAWEPTMDADLSVLFAGLVPQEPASKAFLETTYNETLVRYRNFPDHTVTIDYALINHNTEGTLLLITTSRESMFFLLDSLLQTVDNST